MKTQHYAEIHKAYIKWLNALGFSDASIKGLGQNIKIFFEYLEKNRILSITCLTQKYIQIYFEHLQTRPNRLYKGAGLSAVYLNHNYEAIDKLCEFLHQYGMENAPIPPKARIKMDEEERIRKIQPFTQDEIKQLYDCIELVYTDLEYAIREQRREQLKLVFALFYGCGLRLGEGLNLTIQDIDFDRKTVFVRQGKYYKDRIVPMNAGVCKTVENYVYNYRKTLKLYHTRLFIGSEATIRRGLAELHSVCDNPEIKSKRLYPHILRHSIATHLLQNGMNIENIALFLGHGTLASTQLYTHIVNR